jgi:hypothetical protein
LWVFTDRQLVERAIAALVEIERRGHRKLRPGNRTGRFVPVTSATWASQGALAKVVQQLWALIDPAELDPGDLKLPSIDQAKGKLCHDRKPTMA